MPVHYNAAGKHVPSGRVHAGDVYLNLVTTASRRVGDISNVPGDPSCQRGPEVLEDVGDLHRARTSRYTDSTPLTIREAITGAPEDRASTTTG